MNLTSNINVFHMALTCIGYVLLRRENEYVLLRKLFLDANAVGRKSEAFNFQKIILEM